MNKTFTEMLVERAKILTALAAAVGVCVTMWNFNAWSADISQVHRRMDNYEISQAQAGIDACWHEVTLLELMDHPDPYTKKKIIYLKNHCKSLEQRKEDLQRELSD